MRKGYVIICINVGHLYFLFLSVKIVRGDFLLVSGDLVASVKLEEVIEKHRARVTKDKHSIMTKVYMEAQPGNGLRTRGSEVVLACDKSSQQILFYQRAGQAAYNFPVELFQHDEVIRGHSTVQACYT